MVQFGRARYVSQFWTDDFRKKGNDYGNGNSGKLENTRLLKNRLSKENLLGTFVAMGGVENAEILARAGFDWLLFDLEHSMIDLQDLSAMIAITEGLGVTSLVRVPGIEVGLCKRVLDAGCQGIMFPMIKNAQEAENAVQAVKYPPRGIRGVGIGRAQSYGLRFNEYLKQADQNTWVILQIEDRSGLENLEEIVSVSGIDAIFIGCVDLKKTTGAKDEGELEEYIQKIKKCCDRRNLTCGIVEFDVPGVKKRFSEGFRFVALGLDYMIYMNAVRDLIVGVRKDSRS